MNAGLKQEVDRLLSRGAPPAVVLRHIITADEYKDVSRIEFIKVLLDVFDMEAEYAFRTRGWALWNGKGLTDDMLNGILEGKLKLKKGTGDSPPAGR